MFFRLSVLLAGLAIVAAFAPIATTLRASTRRSQPLFMGLFSKMMGGSKVAKTAYDYIIVGGGTAGCVLANRLSEEEGKKVLMLEAGRSDYQNTLVRIPAGIIKLFKTKYDWNFNSVPEPSVKDREIYLCRGKVLGGSSSLNVLLYHRGNAKDYEQWAEISGDESWGPEHVLPYFKKSEDDFRGESKYHGTGGELSVDEVQYQNELSKTYLRACGESGYTSNDDFNNWSRSQEGYGRYQVTEKNGARCSTASGFLKPALKRKNLDVLCGATVEKVNFDEVTANGVNVQVNGKSEVINLAEGGEVLLTGGSINSPQLLMLSGIGPKEHLEQHGIKPLVDLNGVGKNLQDHPAAVVSYETKPEHKGISVTSKIRVKGTKLTNPRVMLQWKLLGKGPFTSTGCDHGGFFKTNPDLESPDLQMRFLAAKALSPDGMGTFSKFRNSNEQLDGFSFQSIVSRPHSTGSVELQNADPTAYPVIKTGYFSDGDGNDIATMREGLKLSRKLAQTDAFKSYVGAEVYPGPSVQSDEQFDDYIRSTVHTSNALVGTCRIGKSDDPAAVVGADLKVHGVKNLRVIDASVMPKIPGGQTSAPTIMIAEKAAELLLA